MGGANMLIIPATNGEAGAALANQLGLKLNKREGHDLAGPCVACKSSDAFRLHIQTGVAQCYSCGGKWSPFQLAETVTGDREQAKSLLVEIGLFKPAPERNGKSTSPDPMALIARQKGITPDSLRAYGALVITPTTIQLPCYGPDGEPCTQFTISTRNGTPASKGLFAKGKSAGLFFPHVDDQVRLPQPGEVWHLVEGVKDAAALHGLGLLACGMNTCRLAAKFVRLFRGTDIVMVPDRDTAGEEGSQFSARVLRGVAKSVRIAILPTEFKESDGEDVRDVLRRSGGRDLVLQAIADAQLPDGWQVDSSAAGTRSPAIATAEIELPVDGPLKLEVSPTGGKPQRLVVATCGEVEHRDRLNTDSSISRDRFVKRLSGKLRIERDVLAPLVDPQLTKLADEIDESAGAGGNGRDDQEPSQATLAANMAMEWDLFHSPAKDAYATIPIGDHQETWPVRSQTFKRYLAKRFFDEEGKAMNSDAQSAAINLIEAKALFEGQTYEVHVRVAEHEDKIYLDLCTDTWQVVEITPAGWQVLDESPIRFRRSKGMLPLPVPESGGDIDQLRDFLNVDDDTWRLIVAWLVATLRPRGPYPALALFAEQGSGKSTTGRLLRELVDPNAAPLRAEPHDGRDLMIAANNSWCLAYDNLSYVPQWLSDALCRLSTGGGFATRELYTDQDEVIFDSQRPVLLTSIEEVATRSDLLDRCLVVWLPAIPEDRRRPEAELNAEFEKVRPFLLGALLDGVATALRQLPSTKLSNLPRMADFALWATAAESAFGWGRGAFLTAYEGNRQSANEVALEASSVARPLLDLLDERGAWSGTSSALLKELENRVADQLKRQKDWPKSARSMSGHLKRLCPNLRSEGWQVIFRREARQRLVVIERAESFASSAAAASSANDVGPMQSDAKRRELFPNDANDADDAIAGPADPPGAPNTSGWEEGEL
jgi:hypothetical protein